MGVIDNVAVCPIAFNAFEELKTKLGWSRNPGQWRRQIVKTDKTYQSLFPVCLLTGTNSMY